jgi:hypothetical protein
VLFSLKGTETMHFSKCSSSLLLAAISGSALLAGCAGSDDGDTTTEDSSEILGTPGLAYKEPSVIWITRQRTPGYPERSYSIGDFLLQHSNDRSSGQILELIRGGGLGGFLVSNGAVPGCSKLVQGGSPTATRADLGPSFTANSLTNPGVKIEFGRYGSGADAFYGDTNALPGGQIPTGSLWQVNVPAGSQYDTTGLNNTVMQMSAYAELSADSRQRLLNPDRTRPMPVTWDVAAFGNSVHIQANSGTNPADWQGFTCDVPNTGSFTIPVSMLSELPPTGRVVVYATRRIRIPGAFENRPLDAMTLAIESVGDFTVSR